MWHCVLQSQGHEAVDGNCSVTLHGFLLCLLDMFVAPTDIAGLLLLFYFRVSKACHGILCQTLLTTFCIHQFKTLYLVPAFENRGLSPRLLITSEQKQMGLLGTVRFDSVADRCYRYVFLLEKSKLKINWFKVSLQSDA